MRILNYKKIFAQNVTAITFSTGQSVPPGQGENPRLSDGTEHMTLQIYDVSGRLVKDFRITPYFLRRLAGLVQTS